MVKTRTHFAKRKGSRKGAKTRRPFVLRKRAFKSRKRQVKSRRGTFRKRMRGGMTFRKNCDEPREAISTTQLKPKENALSLPLSVFDKITTQPYGILGVDSIGNTKDAKPIKEFWENGAVVDPAGLNYIQGHLNGPNGAGNSSRAIYIEIGISENLQFPDDVQLGIQQDGDAFLHVYDEKTVIHVVGPDARRIRPVTDNVQTNPNPFNYQEDLFDRVLKDAYKHVFEQFLRSEKNHLRLLPISSGVFAGPWATKMPEKTWHAIGLALIELDEDIHNLNTPMFTLDLCIYNSSDKAAYDAAKEKVFKELQSKKLTLSPFQEGEEELFPPPPPSPSPSKGRNFQLLKDVLGKIEPVRYSVVGKIKTPRGTYRRFEPFVELKTYFQDGVVVDTGITEFLRDNLQNMRKPSLDLYQELQLVNLVEKPYTKTGNNVDGDFSTNEVALGTYTTDEYNVIHVKKQDLKSLSDDEIKKKLEGLYKAIFEFFIQTGKTNIRIDPLNYDNDESVQKIMPRITWEAIGRALLQMSDEQLQSLLSATSLKLCFHLVQEYERYTAAKEEYLKLLEST